jgi:hypothetical protein
MGYMVGREMKKKMEEDRKLFREQNAGVLKRALNGFFETQWFRGNRNNMEALKWAIVMENSILDSDYMIEYTQTRSGEITRANKIIDIEGTRKRQGATLTQQYGHLIEWWGVEGAEKLRNYGKLAWHPEKHLVGVISGYYLNNEKTLWRYSLTYVKEEEGGLVISKTAWNENAVHVFGEKRDLIEYLEEMQGSDPDLNSKIDLLETKLGLLNYKGE